MLIYSNATNVWRLGGILFSSFACVSGIVNFHGWAPRFEVKTLSRDAVDGQTRREAPVIAAQWLPRGNKSLQISLR
jgi:hypothetical protein